MDLQAMLKMLGEGFLKTLEIFGLTLIFSLPLGLLVSFGRMSKNCIIRWIMKIYISIMRGTPLMLQLIVFFYGPGLISLFVPYEFAGIRFCRGHYCVRLELFCIFCRDLSLRY